LWISNTAIQLLFDTNSNCMVYLDSKPCLHKGIGEASHYILSEGKRIDDFMMLRERFASEEIRTVHGTGKRFVVTGFSENYNLEKRVFVEMYENYPEAAILSTEFLNRGDRQLTVDRVHDNVFTLDPSRDSQDDPAGEIWTYQGSALEWGLDYIFPVPAGFSRDNFMGIQPRSRTGGGVPLFDYWTSEMGMAIAHIEPVPQLVCFPAERLDKNRVKIGMYREVHRKIAPQELIPGIRTAIIAHRLDYFTPLQVFSRLMSDQGIKMKKPSPQAYEPFWCGWGYESDFTQEEILGTLPKLKELGIEWVVIDDRWFDRYGDWNPRREIFPGGAEELREFVNKIHDEGFKLKIWWTPTNAQPESVPDGRLSISQGISELAREHPEWLIMDREGDYPRDGRNMFFLCPALKEVQEYIRNLTIRFISEWDFDGHKLDAFWVPPPCYNPNHMHARPEESFEKSPELIRVVYEASKRIKPFSVTEICNCGTPQDFYQSVYTDQPVVSDPVTYRQVRLRTKAFKGLWGSSAPVYGDHTELVVEVNDTIDEFDFASTVGTGGVPGTKFTWPEGNELYSLTPEREDFYRRWLDIYRTYMLSRGEYLNLYDIAFDRPETHLIARGDTLFYSFFADSWQGKITLRGLSDQHGYVLIDYVNHVPLGSVSSSDPEINAEFDRFLMVMAVPENP